MTFTHVSTVFHRSTPSLTLLESYNLSYLESESKNGITLAYISCLFTNTVTDHTHWLWTPQQFDGLEKVAFGTRYTRAHSADFRFPALVSTCCHQSCMCIFDKRNCSLLDISCSCSASVRLPFCWQGLSTFLSRCVRTAPAWPQGHS